MRDTESSRRRNRNLTLRLLVMAVAMFGFGYLMVPFYYVLCAATGIGGGRSFDAAATPPSAAAIVPDAHRRVTVEFVATVNEYAPWEFRPEVTSIEVEPGRLYDVKFFARNLSDRHLTGQAVPSIAPGEDAKYLKKTECFCFHVQEFAPEESRDLGVRFYLDPALPEYVDRVTLSYTMFLKAESSAPLSASRS